MPRGIKIPDKLKGKDKLVKNIPDDIIAILEKVASVRKMSTNYLLIERLFYGIVLDEGFKKSLKLLGIDLPKELYPYPKSKKSLKRYADNVF